VEGLWELVELTDFAVRLRYEVLGAGEPPLDRPMVIAGLDSLLQKVEVVAGQ
jgi:hypothetical protein